MLQKSSVFAIATLVSLLTLADSSDAQIQRSSPTGFAIEIKKELNDAPDVVYNKLVNDFAKWYDASHSYGQKAENLSLDFKQHCMLEVLEDGGYVRHMEIVFHQPGKVLRLTGGLGPLQGMGVSGAWTFAFAEDNGKTELTMTYAVSGADFLQLDKIAVPVNQVLAEQMERLKNYCDLGQAVLENAGKSKQ